MLSITNLVLVGALKIGLTVPIGRIVELVEADKQDGRFISIEQDEEKSIDGTNLIFSNDKSSL